MKPLPLLLFGVLLLPAMASPLRAQTSSSSEDAANTPAPAKKKKQSRTPYKPTATERALLEGATPQSAAAPPSDAVIATTTTTPTHDDPHSPRMPAATPLNDSTATATVQPAHNTRKPPAASAATAKTSAPAPKPNRKADKPAIASTAPTPADRPPAIARTAFVPSRSLTIACDGKAIILTLTDLQHLPQHLVSVPDANGNPILYNGPLVADILNRAGLPSSADPQGPILQSFIRAASTDGHSVVYSATELEPQLSSGLVIVALRRDGAMIPSGLQLVDPIDSTPVRSIQALSSLSIVTLTP